MCINNKSTHCINIPRIFFPKQLQFIHLSKWKYIKINKYLASVIWFQGVQFEPEQKARKTGQTA